MARASQRTSETRESAPADDTDIFARLRAHSKLAEANGLSADEVPIFCTPTTQGVIVSVRDEEDGPWTTLRSGAAKMVVPGEALDVAVGAPLVAVRTDRGVFVLDLPLSRSL